ncbi:MAG: efflux RND transporter periplasmic adaptor subunit [Bacteroidia bacterium]|nr:efflux RND transporter periplasmic adaptor subunit [Bacteroidia bacterium]
MKQEKEQQQKTFTIFIAKLPKRITFLLMVVAMFFLFYSCRKPKEKIAENEYYICSMDPQVMEKQPGNCPICQMTLTKAIINRNQMEVIKLSNEQIQLAGIKTATVRFSEIGEEHVLSGIFSLNQNNTEQISSRINGRIEKLYHKIIGEEIKKGSPVYDMYSRELFLAQDEYLIAWNRFEKIENQYTEGSEIVLSAKNKLLLWGMTEGQIKVLEHTGIAQVTLPVFSKVSGIITNIPLKEGDYISEGSRIYALAGLKTLWVEAQLFSSELNYLQEGKKVEIIPHTYPQQHIEGTIIFTNPELQEQSKINLVRIEVDNKDLIYKPGAQVYVILKSDLKKAIAVPVDAVIANENYSIVWVQNSNETFSAKTVKTGMQNNNEVEIISGLKVGEQVVISGSYLLNSEFIFKRGMKPMAQTKM